MEEYLIVFSKWIYRGAVRTTTFPFVRLSNDVAWISHWIHTADWTLYVRINVHSSMQCNETWCEIPPKTFETFLLLLLLRVSRTIYTYGFVFDIRCFILALGFPFHECNNIFLKHSLMALSLCDTDFRAFTHIFFYFFHIFPVLVHSVFASNIWSFVSC